MKRLAWVDAARGIGILSVVYGHALYDKVHASIYTWHMPFFFFLSGFVYRTQETFPVYAKHRARQLLVPYALWLVLVMLPTILGEIKAHKVGALEERMVSVAFGGERLAGPTMAFWFVTSLYLALLAYDALSRWTGRWIHAICAVSFGLACLRSGLFQGKLIFVWEADAVLIALPFIHVGKMARQFGWADNRALLGVGSVAFLVSAILIAMGYAVPGYDVKAGDYGVPGLSFLLALTGIAAVVSLAKAAGPLTAPLAYVGRVSLLIVLTHTALLVFLSRTLPHLSPYAVIALCAGVPLALYPLLQSRAWSRRYLLGEASAGSPSAGTRTATEPPERNPVSDVIAEP